MVVNPGFEEHVLCPDNKSQLDLGHLIGWERGTALGTTDYFDTCFFGTSPLPFTNTDIPSNFPGYQPAYEGGAYAGIIAYEHQYNEYMKGDLIPLTIGDYYKVTIHVSRAEHCKLAINSLGALFFINGYNYPANNAGPIAQAAQADYSSYGTITNTTAWLTLTDTIFADSAYNHIMIGSFQNEHPNVDTISPMETLGAYYYVDYIEVKNISDTTTDTPTAVHNRYMGQDAQLYPNPFNRSATLKLAGYSLHNTLSIYNASGTLVRRIDDIAGREILVERGDLSAGFYYYLLSNEHNITVRGKMIVY